MLGIVYRVSTLCPLQTDLIDYLLRKRWIAITQEHTNTDIISGSRIRSVLSEGPISTLITALFSQPQTP